MTNKEMEEINEIINDHDSFCLYISGGECDCHVKDDREAISAILESAIHTAEKRMIEEIEKVFVESGTNTILTKEFHTFIILKSRWKKLKKKLLTHSSQKE